MIFAAGRQWTIWRNPSIQCTPFQKRYPKSHHAGRRLAFERAILSPSTGVQGVCWLARGGCRDFVRFPTISVVYHNTKICVGRIRRIGCLLRNIVFGVRDKRLEAKQQSGAVSVGDNVRPSLCKYRMVQWMPCCKALRAAEPRVVEPTLRSARSSA